MLKAASSRGTVSFNTARAADVFPMNSGMNMTNCIPGGEGMRSVIHRVPLWIPIWIPP